MYNTELPLKTVVDYFKNLARSHKLVKSFIATEKYDENLSNIDYPLVMLEYPITLDLSEDAKRLTVSFNLHVITNIVYEDGVAYSVNETDYDKEEKINEIVIDGLVGSDNIISSALSILLQLVTKFQKDVKTINNRKLEAIFQSVTITNEERTSIADCYTSTASLSFTIANPFKCNVDDYFDENRLPYQ
jgi:hypothetical protein